VVDKFVGDLIMAVFGAPKSYGKDVANAAHCAMRMMEERRRLNRDGRHRIDVGIGLATGQVVAGCMGSADRLNYTVLGDRVNLAARLCGAAARGEVLIDDATAARLAGVVTAEAQPDLLLKGFAAPVRYYRLTGVNAAPAPT
jgi:class 3 adenylate cyclase